MDINIVYNSDDGQYYIYSELIYYASTEDQKEAFKLFKELIESGEV
jgi:hypothetical protein